MYEVIALGELLIDFTASAPSGQGNPQFEANPGGAPCIVLAMLARLGRRTAFVGKVGEDIFGRMLKTAIEEAGIGSAGLVLDPAAHTTLAFVQNAPDGDREFSFYRDPGADELLTAGELPEELGRAGIFHFGSLSLTREPVRSATRAAVERAAAGGAVISFDPNLRPSLWKRLDDAREEMLWGCSVCQVLKVAEEELGFLTGERELAAVPQPPAAAGNAGPGGERRLLGGPGGELPRLSGGGHRHHRGGGHLLRLLPPPCADVGAGGL